MNFILRTHDKGGGPFRNEVLGPWYTITHRGDTEAFANEHSLMFEEPPKEISDEYFCFIRCERGVIPVFVDKHAYIMSDSGKTFEKIYTHKPLVSESATRQDITETKKSNIRTGDDYGNAEGVRGIVGPRKISKVGRDKGSLAKKQTSIKINKSE